MRRRHFTKTISRFTAYNFNRKEYLQAYVVSARYFKITFQCVTNLSLQRVCALVAIKRLQMCMQPRQCLNR